MLRLIKIFLVILVGLFVSAYIVPMPESIKPPLSTVVRYEDGEVARVYLADDQQWRIYRKIGDTNKWTKVCFIQKEDRFFYWHPGFNPVSLFKALMRYIKYGRVINGGSTITMQLARILEPKERTVISKILEILRAIQFEIRFSKEEILEKYLNYAPFGKNIVGFETASRFYFGMSSEELNLSQCATLANLPQIPGVDFFENKTLLKSKRDFVLTKLFNRGMIKKKDYVKAKSKPVEISPHRFPMEIPHISDHLVLNGDRSNYITTIDRNLQQFVESKLQDYRETLEEKGITNASCVLMDNRTGNVVAIVGSLGYFDAPEGQVRGFEALRQPGSTLKPFLYGLAIDKGIVTPKTMLKDVPISFKDFEPCNFDKKYRGYVRAEKALSYSLNVPFIRLLRDTGKSDFLNLLRKGGITTLRDDDYYGLSVILGACDVTLLELTNLYRMLANHGEYTSYNILKDNENHKVKRLLHEGSCYLVSRALSRRHNPDIPQEFLGKPYLNRLRWKTGTSQKYRDAWTIGYGKYYTLGVWVGNFDASSNVNLVGQEAAAPLFFEILGNIEMKYDYEEREVPRDLVRIKVCPLSGRLVTEDCDNFIYTYTLKSNSFTKTCNIHKKFLIEEKSGLRVTTAFEGMGRLISKVYIVYPPDVREYLEKNLFVFQNIPPIHPACRRSCKEEGIKILSPKDETIYYATSTGELPMKAILSGGSGELYWFLDGKFYKKTLDNGLNFGIFPIGKHTLEVISELGNWDFSSFYVVR